MANEGAEEVKAKVCPTYGAEALTFASKII